jgi:hypothetical protein
VSGTQTDEQAIRVVAIISTFNEADVIGPVIRHLVEGGIEVYVIDNRSTDNTVGEAKKWLGRGVLDVERFPTPGGDGLFRWQEILDRKLAVANDIRPGWVIHHDADEIRYSPWPNTSLRDAIELVDRYGFNAIDFRLLNFPPVDDAFQSGADPAVYFTRYEDGLERDRVQVKCWKWDPDTAFLDGGHDLEIPGKKVFPIKFILCHYPVRGQTHGFRKVFQERKGRFVDEERAAGWHIQYDEIESPSYVFLRNPASLRPFDLDSVRIDVQLGLEPEQTMPEPAVAPDTTFDGVLDVAGPDEISGWARLPNQDEPLDVDLWASDRLLGTVRADRFRQDLKDSGIGSGDHAFSFKVPDALRDGGRYWVWANVAGTARTLQRSPLLFERRSNG